MTLRTLEHTEELQLEAAHNPLPLWHESFWPIDWLALHMSPVYYGAGVRRGDGSPVVVVPGFLSPDSHLYELYGWLGRIGYRPYMSGIGLNTNCPSASAKKLAKTVERAYVETGQRVHIVGHSLGGMIGRRVSLQRPHHVSQLIYLGTPIQGVHTHPAVVAAATMLAKARGMMSGDQCLTSGCACDFLEDARRPMPENVRHAAIYTRADGVVDWHDSREKDPRRNHEVGGTHIGLVHNPRAYKALGEILADRRA